MKLGYAETGKAVACLWDQSELPVLVVQQGALTYSNPAASRVLRSSGIVSRSGPGICFSNDNANAALRALTRTGLQSTQDAPGLRQASMQVEDRRGESWMLQLVRLKPPRLEITAQLFSIDPGVLVMLTPMNAAAALRAGSIDSIATFTPVEKELLHALVDGKTVQQIAADTGRTVATLRWHVRNLLTKTGMRNLTDLIRFASMLMPF